MQERIASAIVSVFDGEEDNIPEKTSIMPGLPPAEQDFDSDDGPPAGDADAAMASDDFVPRRQRSSSSSEPVFNQSKRARVEEVEDEDAPHLGARYPDPYVAGRAGEALGRGSCLFDDLQDQQMEQNVEQWAPFENEEEWELARWLTKNVGQAKTDDFLKLPIVSFQHFEAPSLTLTQ